MNIVIPMAGAGARFRNAGYDIPKPLIPVLGRPMYAWATDSLPLDRADSVVFVLLRSLPMIERLRADIQHRYRDRNPVVLELPVPTRGQAETVLATKGLIDSDEPLLIHNADTAFRVDQGWVDTVLRRGLDGALLVFPSTEPRWSYSRVDGATQLVAEVREKQVISGWASTGTYWFRRGHDFVRLAEARAVAQQTEAGEFYVGPLYNDLILEGGRVGNVAIEELRCFGTPEDLSATLAILGEGSR